MHGALPVRAITNGYDPEEVAIHPLTRKFTITYTCRICEGKQDPELLFSVLHQLFNEDRMDPRDIKVRFDGPIGDWLDEMIRRFGLDDVVVRNQTIPRPLALIKQRESHILLLLNWNDPQELGVYTGKIFEYLAARRPICATGGPQGVVAQLLKETAAGVHVSDGEGLRRVLLKAYEQYHAQGYVSYQGREQVIAKYSHREMAKKFADLLG